MSTWIRFDDMKPWDAELSRFGPAVWALHGGEEDIMLIKDHRMLDPTQTFFSHWAWPVPPALPCDATSGVLDD